MPRNIVTLGESQWLGERAHGYQFPLEKKAKKKPGGLGRAQGLRVLVFRLENPVIQGGFLNG